MTPDANSLPAASSQTGVRAPDRRPRRITRPDPELLIALWKGVWSTVFTVVTLSGLLFACVEDKPGTRHPTGAARHD
ncbi:hypothetical protein [Novosphingobium sp. 9U]|uniref:hypothetical protein n=1 Tax=Novosphingobium sp. 9U TaxID=2653158 RepID=UPI0012F16CCF|nr:hypothetical protein [Novosphingobium sp. 9U]VWX51095.1 hypothetical protein NOVOSPHI9U_370088 [Novosphingobium sp. 9U]